VTPRPCTWPDGGCGEPILDVVTAAGRKQVLDAKPEKRVVLVPADTHRLEDHYSGKVGAYGPEVAVVMDTYVDHHATCSAWAAKLERERAAKAGRP